MSEIEMGEEKKMGSGGGDRREGKDGRVRVKD